MLYKILMNVRVQMVAASITAKTILVALNVIAIMDLLYLMIIVLVWVRYYYSSF